VTKDNDYALIRMLFPEYTDEQVDDLYRQWIKERTLRDQGLDRHAPPPINREGD